MTAIGDGLALANDLLVKQSSPADRRNQVVVLFTDGENNKGRDPLEVLGESNAANIRVHMVGVDLEEEVRNKPQVQRVFQSVQRYGGRYFNATTARDLELASRTIDRLEKGILVSRPFVRDAPVYDWFAFPALVGLDVASGLRAVPYFVDYPSRVGAALRALGSLARGVARFARSWGRAAKRRAYGVPGCLGCSSAVLARWPYSAA